MKKFKYLIMALLLIFPLGASLAGAAVQCIPIELDPFGGGRYSIFNLCDASAWNRKWKLKLGTSGCVERKDIVVNVGQNLDPFTIHQQVAYTPAVNQKTHSRLSDCSIEQAASLGASY